MYTVSVCGLVDCTEEPLLPVVNPAALTSASLPAGPTTSISLQQIQVLAQGTLAASIVNDLFTV